MKASVYTVEWVEDKITEVCIVYTNYDEAMSVYREQKLKDNVTNLILRVRP